MKKYLLFLVVSAFSIACGNNKADPPVIHEDSLTAATPYSWEATLNDSTGKLEMKKKEGAGPDSLSAKDIIMYLNRNQENVQLVLVHISNDTVYLKIPNATYLTQQMGSTGPVLYFSEVVYNLTELPGIRYVNIDFEEGDHASPATLNRESFTEE